MNISHHFGGGVYAKETRIPAGWRLVQHRHAHDHLSILAAGTVEVRQGDEVRVVTGPACITITAGVHHGVKALTDGVWYCIHASDAADVEDDDLIVEQDPAEMSRLLEAMA
jgi:quercetin dioxygenase-like cupin family protein